MRSFRAHCLLLISVEAPVYQYTIHHNGGRACIVNIVAIDFKQVAVQDHLVSSLTHFK